MNPVATSGDPVYSLIRGLFCVLGAQRSGSDLNGTGSPALMAAYPKLHLVDLIPPVQLRFCGASRILKMRFKKS